MADLSVTASLTFSEKNISFSSSPPGKSVDVSGSNAIQSVQIIGTIDETLEQGDIATIGYVLVQNVSVGSLPDKPIGNPIVNDGTPGFSTWRYLVVARFSNGGISVSDIITTDSGAPVLNVTDNNFISWGSISNVDTYDVYRIGSGYIVQGLTAIETSFFDQGQVGDNAVSPAANTSVAGRVTIELGSDGSNYPFQIDIGEFCLLHWNGGSVHIRSQFEPGDVEYLMIEE